MKPEEKAKELVIKFKEVGCRSFVDAEIASAKLSALICCDEIIEAGAGDYEVGEDLVSGRTYWQQVKQEIEKL